MSTLQNVTMSVAVVAALTLAGCGNGVTSDEKARQAYQGLDTAIDKAITLGFQGFNAANSANIAPQTASGNEKGTLTVTGQVDQGSSSNKGMRLHMGMTEYSDGEVTIPEQDPVTIVYATDDASQPALNINLKNFPNGTFDGNLAGTFHMTSDLEGDVTLAISFAGETEDDGTGKTRRKAGTTHVTGTATSNGGTYAVDLTR